MHEFFDCFSKKALFGSLFSVFFLIFASTNNPYIYDRTTVTAKDRVAYVCRQSNHRYRSAAGGQKYAFKDDTCVKETAVITPDNWMEWVV